MEQNKVSVGAATNVILRDIKQLSRKIHSYLLECGVTPKDDKLTTLIDSLEKVVAIKPEVDYIHIVVDSNGYIKDTEEFGAVIEKKKLPADIARGYYKVVKNEIVEDQLMKRKLWEV